MIEKLNAQIMMWNIWKFYSVKSAFFLQLYFPMLHITFSVTCFLERGFTCAKIAKRLAQVKPRSKKSLFTELLGDSLDINQNPLNTVFTELNPENPL